MKRSVFILTILVYSSCSETICENASKAAMDDFNMGQFSLHSREVLPANGNTYFFVLKQYYNVNWYFTDSLDYYRCYDSTMLVSLDKKYQFDILARAREMADSLERTPNWKKEADYPGGIQEVAKYVINRIETSGM